MNGGNLCSGSGCSNWAGTPYANLGWVSDAWVSFDNGITWQQIASSTNSWFAEAATIFDSQGYWYTFMGQSGPPAVANAYSWTNWGYRSTASFNQIAIWPSTSVAPNLVIPSSWTGATQPVATICNITSGTGTGTGTGTNTGSSSSSSLSGGAIAGIVVGSVVGATIILTVLYVMCFMAGGKGKKKGSNPESTGETGTGRFDHVEESQGTDTNTEHHSDTDQGVELA